MRTAQNSGFICADCTYIDLGECTLEKALEEYRNSPWREELEAFDKLDGGRPIPCWPDLTFRIGDYHISFMRSPKGERFTVEVFTPRPKKVLGLFNFSKDFEFKGVEYSRGEEYLKVFFLKSPVEQYSYYVEQSRIYS